LNRINQLIFVIVKCGVLFEVRTGFSFKALIGLRFKPCSLGLYSV